MKDEVKLGFRIPNASGHEITQHGISDGQGVRVRILLVRLCEMTLIALISESHDRTASLSWNCRKSSTKCGEEAEIAG